MNGWDGYSSGSGAGHEPSEDRGQAAWAAQPPPTPPPGTVPPWSSAETQTGQTPPPWASAETHVGGTPPPNWPPPPPPPGPGFTTGPMHAPAPAPRHGARRTLLALTAIAVIGAGAGAGVWYLTRDASTGTGATPATSMSVTATTTPTATSPTTPSASPLASSAPSSSSSSAVGYRRAQDPLGYTIDVPQGWTRREKEGKLAPIVYYDAPGGDRQLQIFEVTEATPYDSLTLAESDPGYGFARQPGYQVLDRDRGDTWAELSYRYNDEDKGARQVVDHRFRAADGTLYAIRSSGPAGLDAALVRGPLAMAVRSFCPAGAQCT
ncbi:hypothetical protein [Streptomyces sp. NBC_00005]|uniref:hypothetical protein n=1 Tax=Streptomyces sp. NBC_00005 TaxID=2903609 RepID=UPI0032566D66